MHRDVKPENFLFLEENLPVEKSTLKMVDFGFAKAASAEELMRIAFLCGFSNFLMARAAFNSIT